MKNEKETTQRQKFETFLVILRKQGPARDCDGENLRKVGKLGRFSHSKNGRPSVNGKNLNYGIWAQVNQCDNA